MKIAIVTIEINTHSGSRAPLELALALAKRGHEITLIAVEHNVQSNLIRKHKKNVNILLVKNNLFAKIIKVFRILRQNNFKLVSFHGNLPLFFGAQLSRIPIIQTYYGTQFNAIYDKFFLMKHVVIKYINFVGNFLTWMIEAYMLASSRQVIAISKYTQVEAKNLYRIQADYCYLGTSSLNFKGIKRKSSPKVTLLSVSRLVPYKGFHELISEVAKLQIRHPQLMLHLAGRKSHPDYFKYLQQLSTPNIKLTVNATDRQLARIYKQADIYVTFDKYIFFGLPILEAFSAGLPVVALKNGAADELITQGDAGFVARNKTEFSNYITHLIDNPALISKMRVAAKKRARQFSWKQTSHCYEKIFKKRFT